MSGDELVMSVGYEGGFMAAPDVFAQMPMVVVAGDGTRYVLGPQNDIFPQPLLPNVLVSDIGESGVQALLELADHHQLLSERSFDRDVMVADASTTVVRITAAGRTLEHRAYALDRSADEVGARADLVAFVDEVLADIPMSGEVFTPDMFVVRSFPAAPGDVAHWFDPTDEVPIVEWPADLVALADAAECVEVPAVEARELFEGASRVTLFADGATSFLLAVRPQLPGDSC